MRCDQMIGLNDWAKEFILGEEIVIGERSITDSLYDGTITTKTEPIKQSTVKKEKYDEAIGFNVWGLNRYIFEDDRVVEEYVQENPWSSGPMFFFALRDTKTQEPISESLWSDMEIEAQF